MLPLLLLAATITGVRIDKEPGAVYGKLLVYMDGQQTQAATKAARYWRLYKGVFYSAPGAGAGYEGEGQALHYWKEGKDQQLAVFDKPISAIEDAGKDILLVTLRDTAINMPSVVCLHREKGVWWREDRASIRSIGTGTVILDTYLGEDSKTPTGKSLRPLKKP